MAATLLATSDEQSFATVGADIVCEVVRVVPNAVLTFATGQSAMPIYRALAERRAAGCARRSQARCARAGRSKAKPIR